MTYFKEGSLSTNQLVGKDGERKRPAAYRESVRFPPALAHRSAINATGRSTDTLHTNLQEQIAKRLDYSPRYGQLRSETLMRDYYEHTRDIFRVTERITQQFVQRIRDEQDPLALQFFFR